MPRGEIVVSGAAGCGWRGFPGYWSDRRIAEVCGVGNRFVGTVRNELCPGHSSPEPAKRIGADGKARSMPTPRESRGWTAPEVGQ